MSTLTPAQAAILTPPVGQVDGVPIPKTIVNPFDKSNIPDTPGNRLGLAFYAYRSQSAQGLFRGIVGASQQDTLALSPDAQKGACATYQAGGGPVLLWTDYYGFSAESVMRILGSQGATSIPAGSCISQVAPSDFSFPIAKLNPDTGFFDVSVFQPAPWAVALLTPAIPDGALHPVGTLEFGSGGVGSWYSNAPFSTFNSLAQVGQMVTAEGGSKYLFQIFSVTQPLSSQGVVTYTFMWYCIGAA